MEYKGNFWLTNTHMVKYQSMLFENLHIQLEVVKTLNLATLLPPPSTQRMTAQRLWIRFSQAS
jgi:hypothetical protein